jgi:processive 1,2-diacylglycerol beta-glucosyltransferase
VLAERELHRGRGGFALVSVATDYGIHGFWPRREVDLFCVADEPSKEVALGRGFDSGTVAVTGIPVRRQFTLEYDRDAALRHFGLPAERRILLALAGSMMPGPYERFKESLAVSLPALASLPNTAVAVVCGNDEYFASELKARSAGFGTTNVHVFDFVEHMAPLMACADLALAKPGGAVCAECLATGLPLVLVGPAAGQENANARALVDAGAAVFAADPRTIAEYARKVVSKPARLSRMREAAVAYARPFAAGDIADRVLALASSAGP